MSKDSSIMSNLARFIPHKIMFYVLIARKTGSSCRFDENIVLLDAVDYLPDTSLRSLTPSFLNTCLKAGKHDRKNPELSPLFN